MITACRAEDLSSSGAYRKATEYLCLLAIRVALGHYKVGFPQKNVGLQLLTPHPLR